MEPRIIPMAQFFSVFLMMEGARAGRISVVEIEELMAAWRRVVNPTEWVREFLY
jgi:hypothetical protein